MIFMKHSSRLLAVFAAVLLGLASHVQAQVVAGAPTTIDYQGKALDATGSPLANTAPTNYEMRFRIYDAQEGGTVIWSEKQIVTVSKGLFSVRLGEGTVLSPAEGSIAQTALADAFASKERFLGVTIVITGQTPAEILPRLAFLATPFAYVASRSVTAERLLLNPSASAPASALSLSQVNYVTQEITATGVTLADNARTYLVNPASPTHLVVNLPGAITTRREYSVMKKDASWGTVTVQAPAGGTLNGVGVVNNVVRLKIRGEGVVVQNTGGNDWWIISDTRDKTPVGTIIAFAGAGNPPPGWELCDGRSGSRTDTFYVELFAAIGTQWGAANATEFNLPDLRGSFLRGKDGNRGQDPDRNSRVASASGGASGDAVGSYQAGAIESHSHAGSVSGSTSSAGWHQHRVPASRDGYIGNIDLRKSALSDRSDNGGYNVDGAGEHTHTYSASFTTNASGSTESRPKNVNVNYFIKL